MLYAFNRCVASFTTQSATRALGASFLRDNSTASIFVVYWGKRNTYNCVRSLLLITEKYSAQVACWLIQWPWSKLSITATESVITPHELSYHHSDGVAGKTPKALCGSAACRSTYWSHILLKVASKKRIWCCKLLTNPREIPVQVDNFAWGDINSDLTRKPTQGSSIASTFLSYDSLLQRQVSTRKRFF